MACSYKYINKKHVMQYAYIHSINIRVLIMKSYIYITLCYIYMVCISTYIYNHMSNNNIHTYIHIYIHKYSLSRWAKAPSNFNKPPRLGQWIPTLKSESWLKGHLSGQRVSGGHTFPGGLSIENVDIMRIHRIFTIFTYSCVCLTIYVL
jgi:hypothetical protein